MKDNFIRIGKWTLGGLYLLWFANMVVNVVFAQRGVTNALIERTGGFGYFLTYLLAFFAAGGCFTICSIVQTVWYHKNKKTVTGYFIPLFVVEIIKIIGTALYVFLIDFQNLHSTSLVRAFIISGAVLFFLLAVFDVLLLLAINSNEKFHE